MRTVFLLLLAISSTLVFIRFRPSPPVLPPSQTTATRPQTAPTPHSTPTLPPSHLIKTAFIPQAPEKNWQQPWQDACEEAALLTVHYYYQNLSPDTPTIVADVNRLLEFEKQLSFSKDVSLSQLATVSSKLANYRPAVVSNPDIYTIKQYLTQNVPVIVPANGKTLYRENRHFSNGGPWYHYLVVLGYDDKKQKFTVHDVGTQHGAYFQYSYRLLMDAIHDWPPTGIKEEIDHGDKNILVLIK